MSALHQALTPIRVGTLDLPHRLVVPVHGGGAGSLVQTEERFEDLSAYWLARLDDGFVWLGGPTGNVRYLTIPGFEPTGIGALGKKDGLFRHPEYPRRMAEFVDRVHGRGGYLGVQLVNQGGMPNAPSATFSGYLDHRGVHVLSEDEIRWYVDEYVESAVIAADCGVDSVELHANHDDVIEWFLSPLTNQRRDGWGGDFARRTRFLREIVDGIRDRVDRPLTLGLRLAMDQLIEGGYRLDECIRIMQSFEADGTVDYVSLDVGGNWGPVSYLATGVYSEAQWADLAREAKAETGLPVMYVGRVTKPETAEQVIAGGSADLVGIVRALIADPRWLTKARSGADRDIRPCITLNDCIHRYTLEGLGFGCGVNPTAGQESHAPASSPTDRRDLLVIGAGPAGLELAGTAAELGHRVRLWEARDHLGGRFAVAARARCNPTYQGWIDWQARRLHEAGVEVTLTRRADVADVLAAGADVVAFATGARPRRPGVPGEYLPHVVGGDSVLLGTARLGPRVLVVAEDDGPAPLTVADHIAGQGHEVVLAYRTPGPATLVGKYSLGSMLARLDADGVEIMTLARLTGIDTDAVEFANPYSDRRFRRDGIDSVVLVTGGIGNDWLYRSVTGLHPDTHLLGDAFAPRRVTFATKQAHTLATAL